MKYWQIFSCALLIFLIGLFPLSFADEIKIHVIDVGSGDAVLLQTDNSDILIDAGSDRNSTALYLTDQNVTDVDLFLVTGYSYDKTGGILEVMNRTSVHEYRDYGQNPSLPAYQRVQSRLLNESILNSKLVPGEKITAGENVFIEVVPVNQTDEDYYDEVLLKITAGNISTLLLNKDAAPEIPSDEPIQILRMADHGSRNGYNAKFIHDIHPEVAIISTGNTNGPDQATVMGLEAAGAEVFRTDIRGTILILTDGEKYDIATNRTLPFGGKLSLVSVIETRPPG